MIMLAIVAIVLAAASIAFIALVSSTAARVGLDVANRFLEQGGKIPSSGEALSQESLERWLGCRAENSVQARKYAGLIMPMDIIFIVLFTGFLLTASIALRQSMPWHEVKFWPYLVWPLPILYAASDLFEDALIIRMLRPPQHVGRTTFSMLRIATSLKKVMVLLTLIQLLALAGLALRANYVLETCAYTGVLPQCPGLYAKDDPLSVTVHTEKAP
jgi:hypothetical protein